jgi:hypothetical protein
MKGLVRILMLSSVILGMLTLVSGCTNYYKVTDPHSGKTYYTTKIEKAKKSGALKLTDERSGETVTVQNSELKEVSKDEYNAGLYPPTEAAEEKQ